MLKLTRSSRKWIVRDSTKLIVFQGAYRKCILFLTYADLTSFQRPLLYLRRLNTYKKPRFMKAIKSRTKDYLTCSHDWTVNDR